MALQLGLTGDVMLGRLVDEAQRDRRPSAIWGDLLEELRSLDGLLVNLECCLSTRGRKWQRTDRPFHFRADPEWAVPALAAAGVDCCALANNHALDFEEQALIDTLSHLDGARIAHAGAGETEDDAFAPATFEIGPENGDGDDALEVAVVALTDNTPEYAAGEYSPGTAHVRIDVDDPAIRTTVQAALGRTRATDPDLLVASLHWGPNMVTEPPESFRRFGRWLVDQGVDLVHGHSAHVLQGVEVYDGVPICYDCGDFVDDYAVDEELRNDRSALFEATVETDAEEHGGGERDDTGSTGGTGGHDTADDGARVTELRLRPTEIVDCSARPASPQAAEWIRDRLRERSEALDTTFERDGEDLVLAIDERARTEPDPQ